MNRPRSLSRRTVVFVVLICLLLPALQVWREWVAYDQQTRETTTALSNLAAALVQHADDTFQVADTALVGIVSRVGSDGIGPDAAAGLNRIFAARSDSLAAAYQVAMYDAAGHWIAGSPTAHGNEAGDQAFFRHSRDDHAQEPFISRPLRDDATGRWNITLSRRLHLADGSFAGVAAAIIDTAYFSAQYATYDLGPGSSIVLTNLKGTVLARFPVDDKAVGADLSNSPLFRRLTTESGGTFASVSPIDGVRRFGAYHRSEHSPLAVGAAMAADYALADWWTDVHTHGAIIAGLTFLIGGLGLRLAQQVGRSQSAENQLRESEARYRLLTGSTTDLITCMDLDFRRTYVSPASRALFGFEPAELVGTKPDAFMDPADVEETYRRLTMLAQGEVEKTSTTYRSRHKQGHMIWVEVNLALMRDPLTRQPAAITGSVRDITERKAQADELGLANTELERLARHLARARDEAERATRVKSSFLASMSHELRTPLHGILGYAQLLRRETGLTTGQLRWIDAMLGAGTHLRQMINGVLDLSEIEAERIDLQTAEVDLSEMVTTCLDLVRPRAEAKDLVLGMDRATGVPGQIVTDPTRLRQILLNLLGNAVKFTEAGKVEVRLRTVDGVLRLEVADTGPGIPPEQCHRLFQDFERLDGAGLAEGTGLGLAISCRLSNLMGGRLGHEDNPGGGSVFFVELPMDQDPLPEETPPLPVTELAAPPETRVLRVLVADDVAMNRDIASSFLRSAGHLVTCAEGGAEAVAAAAAADFDVVLMDVRMPEVDGFEATRRIRALAGPRGQVPVVALTAQAFADQVEQCRKAGMNTHLAKPFAPDDLLAIVARSAAERAPQPEAAAVAAPEPTPEDPAARMAGFAMFDVDAFERTAAFLAPEAVVAYLQTLAARSDALLAALAVPGALARDATELAEAAHTLSGSAGMFGFERLASVARRFERALQVAATEAPALAESLVTVLEASLQEMRTYRTAATKGPVPEPATVYGFVS